MTVKIQHHPRIAWDLARVLVSAAEAADDDEYVWFSAQLGELLGNRHRWVLFDTRSRLSADLGQDRRPAELGLWRARLEGIMGERPELAEGLRILSQQAAVRFALR